MKKTVTRKEIGSRTLSNRSTKHKAGSFAQEQVLADEGDGERAAGETHVENGAAPLGAPAFDDGAGPAGAADAPISQSKPSPSNGSSKPPLNNRGWPAPPRKASHRLKASAHAPAALSCWMYPRTRSGSRAPVFRPCATSGSAEERDACGTCARDPTEPLGAGQQVRGKKLAPAGSDEPRQDFRGLARVTVFDQLDQRRNRMRPILPLDGGLGVQHQQVRFVGSDSRVAARRARSCACEWSASASWT